MKRFILINTIALAGFLALFLSSALAQGGPGHKLPGHHLNHHHYNVVLKHDNGNKHIAHGHCEVHHANGGGHYFPTSEKGEGRLVGHPGAAISCIHGDHMFWGHIPKKGPHNNIVMKAIPLDIWGSISSSAKHTYHKAKKGAKHTYYDAKKAAKKESPAIKKAGKKALKAGDEESDNMRRGLGINCKNRKAMDKCYGHAWGVGYFDKKSEHACKTDDNCMISKSGHPSRQGCKPIASCE
jgi:hypothetical protein